MNSPILSIIIPSYNTSKYVDECLPTFIDERLFGKVIIYLIDDGATDDTEEKIKPYVEKYPQLFQFIHKENGGHGSVINYGVHKLVKTKYFKVIDGDDWVNTDALVKLVDYLFTTDDDAVVSSYQCVYPNKRINTKATDNSGLIANTSYDISFINNFNITIHSIIFKTSIFIDNNIILPEKVFYEDNLYRLYPFLYVKTISFIDEPVYCYRLGNPNQSISIESSRKHLNDSYAVRNAGYSFYADNISKVSKELAIYFSRVLAHGLLLYKNLILLNPVSKKLQFELKRLYKEDKKYPLIIKSLKEMKSCKILFLFHFSLLSISFVKHYFCKKMIV